ARALASLTALTSLDLSDNQIGHEGARALAALTALTSLNLWNNQIGAEGARALLGAWSNRPTAGNLSFLDLRQNGDLSSLLPAEALDTTDAQAILAAYRRFRSAAEQKALRPLNEAKLLVVGNEAVGKTSLIRYLVENKPRNPSEPKTPGAAIHEQIDTRPWLTSEGGVTLNIWDFGGQEMMRGTHRFFLTERSLYLLVLEDRRQDDRSVYDWLKTIRNRGKQSPVIVVTNKCDAGKQDLRLDENRLRQDYPSIVDFIRTSCDPGESAAASVRKLRETIAGTLANDPRLQHVRDSIPQPWLHVKKAVAELARKERVLKLQDFERLCEQPGNEAGNQDGAISDPDEQRALLRLLHDLGAVVAHGLERDAPSARREIALLDPNWLTGAIYTLLNSPTVRDQQGEFSRGQVAELLDPALYSAHWHEFILGMMRDPDVGLCFQLLDSAEERYLVPEALPPNQPDYDVWPADSLRFRYHYEFLPPGLIPRFIVQVHRNLTDKPTRWRTGVVLGAAGCPVLVRGDCDGRRIDIEVAGPAGLRRAALNVVLNDLEYVHRLNPECGEKARVPLPDQPKVSVSYDHLLTLEKRHGPDHKFDPEDASGSYSVGELLEGVRRESSGRGKEDAVRKIEVHINTIHGDVAIGEKIQNSLNKVQAANSSDDLKGLLEQLAQEVAKIAEKLPKEKAEEVADDLDRFTGEVTKDNPKRKWWELSADGILEAAKSAGQIGATAITIIDKVRPLLG
ncbi:MAG: GTP-binding protein, partial [bacterium]|nr:GTP-binding protein [bacterium]